MDRIQTVVLGAGVVGLAVARQLALEGREVLLLEAADAFGTGTSSRNSEVIHAGIYYPAGSLKAKLCVEGRKLLYGYCQERHIPHKQCGKLIVATSASQVAQLASIQAKADANGVASFSFESRTIRVGSTANDIVGKGLIVHRDPDDYKTQPTGNAGPRLACAVIAAKS